MATLTTANIKMRFSEFEDVDDAKIEFAIEEAGRCIDDSWLVKDKMLAWSYLSAHYLMVWVSRAASGTGQKIASERIGEISVTYDNTAGQSSETDLTTTPYGVRYFELAQKNFPAIMVI